LWQFFQAPSIKEYDGTRKCVNDFFGKSVATASTPEPVADIVLKIIKAESPKYGYPIGKNSKFLPALQFLSPRMFETGFLKTLKL
jgi:hypothetical protein